MTRLRAALLALIVLALALAPVASAHSYTDPALRTVFDEISPHALPAGASVAVVPSVVDELVVTNTTTTVLEVKASGGEPFLRISRAGVLANLASLDWWSTGTPEGGVPAPVDVLKAKGHGPPNWALVSRSSTWAEFDTRLHPAVTVSTAQRKAAKEAVLAIWRIPMTYGGTPYVASGHVLFTPVRGGLTTTVTTAPSGVTATALQGELPGLFLQAIGTVIVGSSDGTPFLRFAGGVVSANTSSASWLADQQAKGHPAAARPQGVHWSTVAHGTSYSWLDPRLRYPSDQPPEKVLDKASPTVVRTWSVPVTVNGTSTALTGTTTWVPRAVALHQIGVHAGGSGAPWWPYVAGASGLVLVLAVGWLLRKRDTQV